MIVVSSSASPEPAPQPGRLRLASVDVEWTKNYRVTNGNQPFCCSVTYLDLSLAGQPDLAASPFEFTSCYLEPGEPTARLAASADALISQALAGADVIAGHQLCADLAVLARTAGGPVPAVDRARAAWHSRRTGPGQPRFVDTRYDAGHLLAGTSRRLVDVATELSLDVTQPELRGTSMTALHRTWVNSADATARERISVLNLRHSLSTALIALRTAGVATWAGPLNVNEMIARQAAGSWAWLDSPGFRKLYAYS